ncbi:MAG: hypothetical protein WD356_06065 [Pseudomonadales bacterium]
MAGGIVIGTHVLTVNTGSSSVKLGLYCVPDSGEPPRIGASSLSITTLVPALSLQRFLAEHGVEPSDVIAVSHRIVHGGNVVTRAVCLDEPLEARLDRLTSLAPLHNPVAFEWLRCCRRFFGTDCRQILVPDTGFFHDLPEVARDYALPAALTRRYPLRRYGFHGLAHQAMWLDWRSSGERRRPSRLISIQLGGGCSIAAILDGKPLDTSMGFTPLEGLVMATRSGDLDPGLVTWLQREENLDSKGMERLLNEWSGLYGVSGISGDMQTLLKNDSKDARRAVDLYVYRVRKYIGAYVAILGGVDGIMFGGGVGENAPEIRAGILTNMDCFGVELDSDLNKRLIGESGAINNTHSRVEVRVTRVDEGALLAREAIHECHLQGFVTIRKDGTDRPY